MHAQLIVITQVQDTTTEALRTLCAGWFFVVEAVLCIAECFIAILGPLPSALVVTTNVSHWQLSPWRQNCPQWRITALRNEDEGEIWLISPLLNHFFLFFVCLFDFCMNIYYFCKKKKSWFLFCFVFLEQGKKFPNSPHSSYRPWKKKGTI